MQAHVAITPTTAALCQSRNGRGGGGRVDGTFALFREFQDHARGFEALAVGYSHLTGMALANP